MTPSAPLFRAIVALAAIAFSACAGLSQERDLPPGAVARLGSMGFLHGDRPFVLALPSGERGIIVASQEQLVRVWDRATGKVARTFASEGSSQVSLALSPDGALLAAGDNGSNLRLWDFATGKLIAKHRSGDTVCALAWSEDGKTLAASDGNSIALFDRDLRPTRRLAGHPKHVRNLRFAGELLLSAGAEQKIAVWDLAEGRQIRVLEGQTDWNGVLAISPDRKRVASDYTIPTGPGSYRSVLGVWQIETGKCVLELPGSSTNCAVFSKDGRTLISGDAAGYLRSWDLAAGKEIKKWFAHFRSVALVALADDGRTLISGGADRRLRFWDIESGKEQSPAPGHSGAVQTLAFSPDAALLVSGGYDGTIRFWDWPAGRELQRVENLGAYWGVRQLAFVGDMLVSLEQTTHTAIFRRWSRDGKEQVEFGEKAQHVSRFAPLPDDRSVAGACWDGSIRIWDAASGRLTRRFGKHKQRLLALAVAPDGRAFAWAREHHDLGVCDAEGNETSRLKVGSLSSHVGLAYSPDGALLAASSHDGVHLWQTHEGKPALTIPDSRGVSAIAFSPDGTTLAMLSGSKLALWDVPTRQRVAVFSIETDAMEAFAWSPDARALATGTRGGLIYVWDATGGGLAHGKLKPVALDAREAVRLWEDLASKDAERARRAAWKLAASPQGVKTLAERLRPVVGVDAESLDRLVGDLEDDDFFVRQKANQVLAGLGQVARDTLEKIAAKAESTEARGRAKELLLRLESDPVIMERRRTVRAVALLEWSGSGEARKLLETLASGSPAVPLTRAAQAALARSAKR